MITNQRWSNYLVAKTRIKICKWDILGVLKKYSKKILLQLRNGQSRLTFNAGNAKFMLLKTKQMSVWHKLKDQKIKIPWEGIKLKRLSKWKLLDTITDKNLTMSSHISKILKNSYSHLSILCQLHRR